MFYCETVTDPGAARRIDFHDGDHPRPADSLQCGEVFLFAYLAASHQRDARFGPLWRRLDQISPLIIVRTASGARASADRIF
jgi:hypothetical protein